MRVAWESPWGTQRDRPSARPPTTTTSPHRSARVGLAMELNSREFERTGLLFGTSWRVKPREHHCARKSVVGD